MNRDLSRRIRTVTGLTVDKKVVRNDIRLAAKVITNLDKRWGLWTKDQPEDGGEEAKKVGCIYNIQKLKDNANKHIFNSVILILNTQPSKVNLAIKITMFIVWLLFP